MAQQKTTVAILLEGDAEDTVSKWMGTISDSRLEQLKEALNVSSLREAPIRNNAGNHMASSTFDTGVLPVSGTGLLRYQKGVTQDNITIEQVAIQIEPRRYNANFNYAGIANSALVSHPYLVLVSDWFNGRFKGCRGYYSPTPIKSDSSPLYHINLPNMNCLGYRDTTVGWICFYPDQETGLEYIDTTTVEGKITYTAARWYDEPFVSTMTETDGPKMYTLYRKAMGRHKPLSTINRPGAFSRRSTKNKTPDWICQEKYLIPILVGELELDNVVHSSFSYPHNTKIYARDIRTACLTSNSVYAETPMSKAREMILQLEGPLLEDGSVQSFTFGLATREPYQCAYPRIDFYPNKPFLGQGGSSVSPAKILKSL